MGYFEDFEKFDNAIKRVKAYKSYLSKNRDLWQAADMEIRKKSGLMKNTDNVMDCDLLKLSSYNELVVQIERTEAMMDRLKELEDEVHSFYYDLQYYLDYLYAHDYAHRRQNLDLPRLRKRI